MEPSTIFSIIYAILFAGLLGTEIVGVRRKAKDDTITENWRKIDKNLNGVYRWFWRVLTAGMLGWILIHLPGKDGW
jgi:hypothetical protein